MVSRAKPVRLTENELEFWDKAFLAAELSTLIQAGIDQTSPVGLAHAASEYASAAVIERRRVIQGDAS
jgi:hypothetical protein